MAGDRISMVRHPASRRPGRARSARRAASRARSGRAGAPAHAGVRRGSGPPWTVARTPRWCRHATPSIPALSRPKRRGGAGAHPRRSPL